MKSFLFQIILFALLSQFSVFGQNYFDFFHHQYEFSCGVDCTNSKEVLENSSEDILECSKIVLHRYPKQKQGAKSINYDLGLVTLTEFQQIQSIKWPFYPRGYHPDQDDLPSRRWVHTVLVYVPKVLFTDTAIYLATERFGAVVDDEDKVGNIEELTEQEKQFALVSQQSGAVLIIQYNNPNLPTKRNGEPFEETELQAYSQRKFIENPQKYAFHLLEPAMSTSILEIMSFAQQQAKTLFNIKISDFVLSGISKRGQSSLLSSIVDRRIRGVIPIVFDSQNIVEQSKSILENYGNLVPAAFGPFNVLGISNFQNFDKERSLNWDKLVNIVDPYAYRFLPQYRDRFKIPKYFINASGDDFFLPEGSTKYFQFLPGNRNFLLYLENSSHFLDSERVIPTFLSFFNRVKLDITAYPTLEYTIDVAKGGKVTFTTVFKCQIGLSCEESDIEAKLWVAENPVARDFRYSCMLAYQIAFPDIAGNTGIYVPQDIQLTRVDETTFSATVSVDVPALGYKAAYIKYKDQTGFEQSTSIKILRGKNTDPQATMPQDISLPGCILSEVNTSFL